MYTDCLQIARGLLFAVVLLLVAGCGGGGGGGGSSSGVTPLQYEGNTSAAVVTTANAAKLVTNVYGGDTTSINAGVVTGVSSQSVGVTSSGNGGLSALTQRLNKSVRASMLQSSRARSAQRPVLGGFSINDTEPCDSGSVRTTGTLNDTNGTGTLTITYNDCRTGDETLKGQATVRVDAFDLGFLLPTDYTLSFARLTIRAPGVSIDFGGSSRLQRNIGNKTESLTDNVVVLDNLTHQTLKTEDLVFVDVYNDFFSPTSVTESVNGRIFDGVLGFVDVTTIAPFFFHSLTQAFPETGGMLLTGDGNRSIKVRSLSATAAELALDLNGDSAFEIDATLKWTDLAGPVGTDLADNDGDGMHNGWETAYGLNPNNLSDAALDKDGDGASNLAEYRAGSNPNDATSAPPIVDLSIAMFDSPDPINAGSNLTYTITVSNSSSSASSNVVLIDTLPVGVNLVSAISGQGSCTGTATLTCNLGTLSGFGSVVVTVVVTPAASGAFTNIASVTGSAIDQIPANNEVSVTTTVWQQAAERVLTVPGNSDLLFDSGTQRIYVSILGNPGSVAPIDPVTGNVGTAIPVGTDPTKLARSSNGQFLYVGLDGQSAVQRINLSTQAVVLTIPLGGDSFFGPHFVEDMEVLPGSPQSIAVSMRYKGVSPRHAGVAIFDNDIQRPITTPGHTGSNVIEFSASAGTLYGYNNETTEFGFRRMAVGPSGVSTLDVFDSFMGDLISGFGVDIRFHDGLIYTTTGRAIDPIGRSVLGTFSLPTGFGNFVTVDSTIGRAFYLTQDGFSGTWSLRAFDLTTRQFLGGVVIPGFTGNPASLIRWGTKGLAFRTSGGQVHLVESPSLIP